MARLTTARANRAADSDRCTYRPSQYRSSATRLGRSAPPRLSDTFSVAGVSSVTVETGPVLCTQTSLLPPPFCKLTTNDSADCVTRVSPPAITV